MLRLFGKKSDMPKVSIVIPIYNVEKYLGECLDSVVNQKLRDVEIICVDDGSTDGSLEIVNEYASKDDRIVVISKENRGYGHTMNMGFAAAKGEYIGIVESDDYADSRMFRDLYRFAKRHDCDVVKSNYFEHCAEGDKFIEPFREFMYKKVFDPWKYQGPMTALPINWSAIYKRSMIEENGISFKFIEPFREFMYKKVFDPWKYQGPMTALPINWSAIYKRSMIEENGISFNETPGASYQDTSFVHQVWMGSRRAAILPKGYIHYRVDNAASSVKSSSKVYAVCDEYAKSEEFMCRYPEREAAFANIMCLMKLGTYRWNFNRIKDEYRVDFAQRMHDEYSYAREKGWLNREYFNNKDWSQLVLLINDIDGFMDMYGESGM